MQRQMILVKSIKPLSRDILGFTLASATGRPLLPFEPGAHIDVHLPNGMSRQYSLYNTYAAGGVYEIAVKLELESRGGSAFLHSDISEGEILQISAPKNLFALDKDAPRALLLAGGIGVTPVLSMAQHLADTGQPFTFEYFVRSREDAAFLDKFGEEAFESSSNLNIGLTPDETAARLSDILSNRAEGTHVYFCGPGGFVSAVRKAADHWPDDAVHYESFSAADTANQGPNASFEVTLAKSGKTLQVAGDQSLADALSAAGIPVETSCGQGICGTCRTAVLEGVPEHRDMILSGDEKATGKVIMACVSRAVDGPLVLDL